jgi:hypothetical protein
MTSGDVLPWSVAVGQREREAALNLAASIRAAGAFATLHVLTDATIPGCECYDWMGLEPDNGFRYLAYLKGAVSKLPCEHLLFLDPWHRFFSRPAQLSAVCALSPVHLPLEGPLLEHPAAAGTYGMPAPEASALLRGCGLKPPHYFARPVFMMVRRSAVDCVFSLGHEFRERCRSHGTEVAGALALAYVVQMLCANPEAHRAENRRDLWLPAESLRPDELEQLESGPPGLQRAIQLLALPSAVYFGPRGTESCLEAGA